MNYYALIYETVDDYVARRFLSRTKLQLAGRLFRAEPHMNYYALIYETVDDYVARRFLSRTKLQLAARLFERSRT